MVTVSDDGRGLDLEKIRRGAVERGILAADTRPSDAELRNLIFAPGFSTATEVSELSGRGVGMDVVRRTIDSFGGTIETESEVNEGTTIRLKLPLTLAIIHGLLVRVGEERYIIPLADVEELVEFRQSDVRRTGGHESVPYRETLLPFVDLHASFESVARPPERGRIVVVSQKGLRIGLLVSEVIGQQQAVIKRLGSVARQFEGVSGATILGDGRVALILDIAKLKVESSGRAVA